MRLLDDQVPVRVVEEAYENQRWNPVDGFCDKLLPTDRHAFSSKFVFLKIDEMGMVNL